MRNHTHLYIPPNPIHSHCPTSLLGSRKSSVMLSNSLARNIGKLVAHPTSDIAGDALHLPRITANGIPIYDSLDKYHNYSVINKVVTQITPVFILALSPSPTYAVATYGLLAYVYYVHF